jgi:hypothetical protein
VGKRKGKLKIDIKCNWELKKKDSVIKSFASPAAESIQLQMLETQVRRMHEQKTEL